MTTINVSNATELKSAIASAVGGEHIVLADGNYGAVTIFNRAYSSTVTFEAAGTGAHLDDLFVAGSKNLSFVGLDVGHALRDGEQVSAQLSYIKTSTNVTVDGVHFHGSLDTDPGNDGIGLTVTSVTDFTVTNSRFEDLYRGLVLQGNTNTTVLNNEITTIRSDGIISVANDGLAIQGNHIGEFRPNLGDHSDAIQFWNTGQIKGQTNITIKDNIIYQSDSSGAEAIGIQGIFMSDPLSYGYKNVLIENNVLYSNNQYNGVYVNGADGVQVLGNTVLSKSSDEKSFWVLVRDSSHIALQDNVTDRITTSNVTDFFQSGNTDLSVTPTARDQFPNLASPNSVADLLLPHSGYHIPTTPSIAPVSAALGIGLPNVSGASISHAAAPDTATVSHSLLGISPSPDLNLTAVTPGVVAPRPVVQEMHLSVAPDFSVAHSFHSAMHWFFEPYVALP